MSAKLRLLADENVHARIIDMLRGHGIAVESVRETASGIPDIQVLELARSLGAILLTEDSDFGELVFAYGARSNGIIYLCYQWREVEAISKAVLQLVDSRPIEGNFIVLTTTKLRSRPLHG